MHSRALGRARAQEVIEQLAPLDLGGIKLPVVRKAFADTVDGLPEPQALMKLRQSSFPY